MGIELLQNIVIPLGSSFIGATAALLSVKLNNKKQDKRDAEHLKQSVKPYFYITDSDDKKFQTSIQLVCGDNNSIIKEQIVIRNTDNGVLLIDSLTTENLVYTPLYGRVVDKSSYALLNICIPQGESLKDMILNVSDVLGNKYRYRITMKADTGYNNSMFVLQELTDRGDINNAD